ncbi:MotB family protein [Bartonella sp. LJL80]
MKSVDPETHNEIIIVRRGGGGDHDEHHGGVWKIAYADFMTAMMAFFLVMWLINAANEETKAAVASYFNPIKLVDRRTNPRGIQENDAVGDNEKKSGTDAQGQQGAKAQSSAAQSSAEEAKMMSEPYEVLEEIAEVSPDADVHLDGAGGASEGGAQKGASEGTAYRDPFSPDYWSKNAAPDMLASAGGPNQNAGDRAGSAQIQAMIEGTGGKAVQATDQRSQVEDKAAGSDKGEQTGGKNDAGTLSGQKQGDSGLEAGNAGPATQAAQDDKAAKAAPDLPEVKKPDTSVEEAKGNSVGETVKEISTELNKLVKDQPGGAHPMVRVVPVNDGVAIELMDQTNYGMFTVGSAKPDKQTVDLLAGIAKILEKREGEVVISGHTDARPYKTSTYDNWQLSSSRAQMAYYMLVRGGLDEKRILRVEGYADRELKNKKDPYAAENRRIEIFMRLPQNASPDQAASAGQGGKTP